MHEQDSTGTESKTGEQQMDDASPKPGRTRKKNLIKQAEASDEAAQVEGVCPQEPVQQEVQEEAATEVSPHEPAGPDATTEQPAAGVEGGLFGEPDAEESEEQTEAVDDVLQDGLLVREVIEAMVFAADSPLPASKIAQVLEHGTSRQVRKYILQLNERYEQAGATFRIEEVAGGYQMLTLSKFQPWLVKLLRARQESRLSPTQMETLAIIAYKQPVLRADIEAIRGVAVGDVVNRLRELGLVKIVGKAEDVGRPLLYGTTKKFLRVFGLGSLDDLPRAEELKPPAAQPVQAAKPDLLAAAESSAVQGPAEQVADESRPQVHGPEPATTNDAPQSSRAEGEEQE